MVRISIPTLPAPSLLNPLPPNPLAHLTASTASAHLAQFLASGRGRTMLLTGAGVSVDSGIRAYRGKEGHYTLNQNFRPVYYGELIDPSERGDDFRRRYWSRGYMGWPPVRDAAPNPTHYGIAALMWMRLCQDLITQNVDGLHVKASPYSLEETNARILALHGTLHLVHCNNGHQVSRENFQSTLSELNPTWKAFADEAARTKTEPRTNPDGDVDLGGVSYDSFKVPSCETCGGILKPDVVFFGESIADSVKQRASQAVANSSQVLVLGSSLATYSAFRLIKQAREEGKPVLLLSLGPTRADALEGIEKIELPAGPVLAGALQLLVGEGTVHKEDEMLIRLMRSGVIKSADERGGTRHTRQD